MSNVALKNWECNAMNVETAFLNGELREEVYMSLPPGFDKGKNHHVCKLKKSIYGLKQSPRAWFDRFSKVLKSEGYQQSLSDHTMFVLKKESLIIILIVYVDDIILTGNDTEEITRIKMALNKEFEVKDLGNLKYFLGMEVARSREGIYVSQRKYILDLLKETGMLGCRPSAVPISTTKKVKKNSKPAKTEKEAARRKKQEKDEVATDKGKYQRLVGKLIYLSHTRPDIAFAVSVASQHMHAPKKKHLEAAYKILRYLKGTPGQGLFFRKNESRSVEIYTDADWVGDQEDSRSTSGYCTYVWGNLVTWQSQKQRVVSKSSAESELRALAQGIMEGLWLKRVTQEAQVKITDPLKLYCDNKAAISMALNPVQHSRTKHVEVDRHFIREKVEGGVICLSYIPTKLQLADVLTKGLPEDIFKKFVSKLDMIDIYSLT